MVTADRRWRIEADAGGKAFRVTRNGDLMFEANSLSDLVRVLADYGIEIEDLTEG